MNTSVSRFVWLFPILFGSIVAPIITALLKSDNNLSETKKIIFIAIVSIIILLSLSVVIFFDWFSKMLERFEYRLKSIKSDFVFNHVKITFEYIVPDGSITSYRRDDHITNIKSKKTLKTTVNTEGEILKTNVSGINTAFSFISKNIVSTHHQTKSENLTKWGDYHSSYSLLIKDGFIKNDEKWTLSLSYYCKFYEFELIIPNERELLEARLFHKAQSELDWAENDRCHLLVTKKMNCTVISAHITAFRQTDKYMLNWKFKN
jgi:hypothetical protein